METGFSNPEQTLPELTPAERTALILKEVVASRLNSEIKNREFYTVCPLHDIATMSGPNNAYINSKEFRILKTLHCTHYNTMTDAVKRNIVELTIIFLEPMVGTLRVSDKTHRGVRLFETAYLPESFKMISQQEADKKRQPSIMARILSGFGVRG